MIKNIRFKNFRKFNNEVKLDFYNNEKNSVNKLMGITGFSSSGKTTILNYMEFIPVLWNLKIHYSQFIKTSVLSEVLKEYKEKNINFINKYKTPIEFQQSEEYQNKYNELLSSEEMSEKFLKCNLFKLNMHNIEIPLISEISYSLSNNDYVEHKIILDLKNNKITETFLLNGDERLDSNESEISEFQSIINVVLEKLNEKPLAFINLSNLSKGRLAIDEQNRRLFGIKINEKHRKLFKIFINLFDPNINHINYNQNGIPVTYAVGEQNDVISFNDLSTGTRKAIYLWSQLYVTLILNLNKTKYFFVYDEIQDNWNLALIDLIFYFFKNPKTNAKNSQLLFSTHNPVIMENFSNDKIFLINDNNVIRVDKLNLTNKNFSNAYFYDKLVKNNYKNWLNDFVKELSKIG